MRLFFTIFLILLVGCDESSGVTVAGAPPFGDVMCRHDALYLVVIAEDYGFEAVIVTGKLNGVAHAQAKYYDGKEWLWLGLRQGSPVIVKIDGFVAENEYSKRHFQNHIDRLARENNYYDE